MGTYFIKQEDVMGMLVVFDVWLYFMCNFIQVIPNSYKYILPITVIIAISTIFILLKHNRNTYILYELKKIDSKMMNAKVLWKNIQYTSKYSIAIHIRFELLETGEVFEWKESYSCSIAHRKSIKDLFHLTEVEVIVDKDDHSKHYVILKSVWNLWIYKNQSFFYKCNVLLISIGVFLFGCIIFYTFCAIFF